MLMMMMMMMMMMILIMWTHRNSFVGFVVVIV